MEKDYRMTEQEAINDQRQLRLMYEKMTPSERLELAVTTLILSGARPKVSFSSNKRLGFCWTNEDGIDEYVGVEKEEVIDNAAGFCTLMEVMDNKFGIPSKNRMSLEGREAFFAKRIYDRFATFDLSNSKLPERIPNRLISADWNEWMQGKYAVINDKARENPARFNDIVEGLCQDNAFDGRKDALYKVTSMRQTVACSTISTLKSIEALREDTAALENNFGANKIVENVNDFVDKVNEQINMNAHQFKRADLYEEGAKE